MIVYVTIRNQLLYYSDFFNKTLYLKYLNLKNKAISSPICNRSATF